MFSGKYALAVAAFAVSALCAADGGHSPRMTRQDLIGAWRLLDIEVQGPAGPQVDPFYGRGSRGLLIYDASGWFSVQIEGSGRPALQVPSVRPVPQSAQTDPRLSAAVLDSYYAYYGTWSFEPATATVTHHAQGALYPAENQATYAQHVEIVGQRLFFTRTQKVGGQLTMQTKRWERVSGE